MLEYVITQKNGIKEIKLTGRIDSLGSENLQVPFKELTLSGERKIIVSFEQATYISSAGLRVFLIFQKELKKVGGEIILYKMSDYIYNIFKTGGFDRLFRIINKEEELCQAEDTQNQKAITKEINGLLLDITENPVSPANIFPIGSEQNLYKSAYTQENVVSIAPRDIKFGLGLASLGENYEEYKNYFGESIIINGNLFVYSAVKRPSVDFMMYSGQEVNLKYPFLYGVGFSGMSRYILSFRENDSFIQLPALLEICHKISDANLIGIIFLAESKGIWGMHLKRIPVIENKPPDGKDILDHTHFPEWMNFSIEPEDIDRVVLGCGIAIKDKSKEMPHIRELIPQESNSHIHACIFEQGLFNKDIFHFDEEMRRVMNELQPLSIKHLLNKTQFKSGMVCIIELR